MQRVISLFAPVTWNSILSCRQFIVVTDGASKITLATGDATTIRVNKRFNLRRKIASRAGPKAQTRIISIFSGCFRTRPRIAFMYNVGAEKERSNHSELWKRLPRGGYHEVLCLASGVHEEFNESSPGIHQEYRERIEPRVIGSSIDQEFQCARDPWEVRVPRWSSRFGKYFSRRSLAKRHARVSRGVDLISRLGMAAN